MSNPYEIHAADFIAARSGIGARAVERWARAHLRPGGQVLDLGCGHGFPVSWVLSKHEVEVFGIDASPTLVAEFRRRWPGLTVRCEDVLESDLYGRAFDAVTMIGLVFLFSPADQERLIGRAARALKPGGRLLFTAPAQVHEWDDVLTGQRLRSLGEARYAAILRENGLRLVDSFTDAGGNHYVDAVDRRRLAS